jgi:hypothetical protein
MKLNRDCIRDILLLLEERTPFDTLEVDETSYSGIKLSNRYFFNVFTYHLHLCEDAGFILMSNGVYTYSINRLTYQGHEYLENIRKNQATF